MARKRKRFRRIRRQERWALTCERVFSVLTSGPFPSGSPEDDLIDAHLSFCPDCRRLAEALRPTEDMLAGAGKEPNAQDGKTPPAADKLPGYWNAERRLSALDELDFVEGASRRAPLRRHGLIVRWAALIGMGVAITVAVLLGLYRVGCLIDAIHRP